MLGLLVGAYLLLLIASNVPMCQRNIARLAELSLSKILGTEVLVEKVEIGLFNRLIINDIIVKDKSHKVLLDCNRATCKIEWLPLLKGDIVLRTISLLDTKVTLYKTTKNDAMNFQFLVDLIQRKDKKKQTRGRFAVGSLILRRCALTYDEHDVAFTPQQFNPAHINIQNLNASISLRHLSADSLNFRIRGFNLLEHSGLNLKTLRLRLAANRQQAIIDGLAVEMPETRIAKERLTAHYDARHDLRTFLNTLTLSGELSDAFVSVKDFHPLMPVKWHGVDGTFELTTEVNLSARQLSFPHLQISGKDNGLRLSADIDIARKDGRIHEIVGNVANFQLPGDLLRGIYTAVSAKSHPQALAELGDIRYTGKMRYAVEGKGQMDGQISTAAGSLLASVKYEDKKLDARVSSANFSPHRLYPHKACPDKVNFRLEGNVDLAKAIPDGNIQCTVKELRHRSNAYRDLVVDARLANGNMTAHAASKDERLNFTAHGKARFDGKYFKDIDCSADIHRLAPKQLGWTEYFGDADFSVAVKAHVKDTKQKVPHGILSLEKFRLSSLEKNYLLQYLSLAVEPLEHASRLKLRSDFAALDFEGELSLKSLTDYAKEVVSCRLPNILPASTLTPYKGIGWNFSAKLYKTDFLQALFNIPLTSDGEFFAEGSLPADGEQISVSSYCDGLTWKNFSLHDMRLHINGNKERLMGLVQTKKKIKNADVVLALNTKIGNGGIATDLLWDDGGKHKYNGALKTQTTYRRPETEQLPYFTTQILPTSVAINDTVWNIDPGQLQFDHKGFQIDKFSLQHEDHSLFAQGRISPSYGDSVTIDLHRMDIAYILGLINFNVVEFAGLASGTVNLSGRAKDLQINGRLGVDEFRFNNALLGKADIQARWNMERKSIDLLADMVVDENGKTHVEGYVSPAHKNLDLLITSQNTSVSFLNKYVGGIFSDVEGTTTGDLRLFGPFKKLDFQGKQQVELTASLPVTGVKYTVTGGELNIKPGCFEVINANIIDRDGNKGSGKGNLWHAHLKNLEYDFSLEASKMLVYDRPKEADMPFYATVYGTGKIDLSGRPGHFSADANIRPTEKTLFVYTLDTPDNVGDVKFLTIRDKNKPSTDSPSPTTTTAISPTPTTTTAAPGQTDIRLNFLVDIAPEAALKIITDERAGDNIHVYGDGVIRADWHNKGNFHMYGFYNVDHGVFKMSIQDIIRKDFTLTPGGKVSFNGDPTNGDLNLSAIYTVNSASLSDLNIGTGLSENTTRANCILNIGGKVRSPEVSFSLDLPDVSEDEKQMVRSLLGTEEDLNMQILYLLGVGRFYTYDYGNLAQSSEQSQSSVAMKSFLSNTLSSQLNNIISNAIGNNNWTFGTNLSTGNVGWSDMEVEGLLSGRLLNNRLLINGNFGYRDRTASLGNTSNTTNFVGDFDINYLITPSGSVSLKAYSETNDRYFSKSTLTTQGVGILLKRDFFDLRDLFTTQRKRLRLNNPERSR